MVYSFVDLKIPLLIAGPINPFSCSMLNFTKAFQISLFFFNIRALTREHML